jgi:hypothetical protein
MRRYLMLAAAAAVVITLSSAGYAQQISGDYIETRSADVYTGPCFANAEVNLVGNEAILAWRINQGQWNGVNLGGLSVVGVVRANGTLGDPYENPYPAKAVLIVDQKATRSRGRPLSALPARWGAISWLTQSGLNMRPLTLRYSIRVCTTARLR